MKITVIRYGTRTVRMIFEYTFYTVEYFVDYLREVGFSVKQSHQSIGLARSNRVAKI